jgi:HlyD family secretion protein
MLRQVRGNGTLVPEQMLHVQADTEGRIERILILPGAEVQADTVLLNLSNPELEQSVFDMEWQLKAAQAQLIRLEVHSGTEAKEIGRPSRARRCGRRVAAAW